MSTFQHCSALARPWAMTKADGARPKASHARESAGRECGSRECGSRDSFISPLAWVVFLVPVSRCSRCGVDVFAVLWIS